MASNDSFDFGDDVADDALADSSAGSAGLTGSAGAMGEESAGLTGSAGAMGEESAGLTGSAGAMGGDGAMGSGGGAGDAGLTGSAGGGGDDQSGWADAVEEADASDRSVRERLQGEQASFDSLWAPPLDAVRAGKATLRRCSRGSGVRDLQRQLNEAGVTPELPESGYYDDEVEAAVVGVQRSSGVAQTGEVDRTTLVRIQEMAMKVVSDAPAMQEAPRLADVLALRAPGISAGQEGRPVTELQRLLNRAGASPSVPATGLFDLATERAVRRFQLAQHMQEVGTADRLTIVRLQEVVSRKTVAAGVKKKRPTPILPVVVAGEDTLRDGDRGAAVREVQEMINAVDTKSPIAVNGTYDEQTKRAVLAFQRDQGLARSGEVDRPTLLRLRGQAEGGKGRTVQTSKTPPTTHDVLNGKGQIAEGHEGAPVRDLQEALNAAGAKPPVTADGKFTRATADAVRRFQHGQGLSQSGAVDRTTMARLLGQFELVGAPKRERGYRGKNEDLTLAERRSMLEATDGSLGLKIDPVTRVRMEAELETDLQHVFVHADRKAGEACRAVQAEAFALKKQGQVHLYFAEGKYKPGTVAGDRLLLHELVHALQIKRGRLRAAARKQSSPSHAGSTNAIEAEADARTRAIEQAGLARAKADAIRDERDRGRPARAPKLHDLRSGKAILELGHEGDSVRRVQELLNLAGTKHPVAVDGKLSEATERAIVSFQREQGLPRDGQVNRFTLERLEGQGDETKGRIEKTRKTPLIAQVVSGKAALERGDEGPSVKELQTELNRAGAKPPVIVDGKYGTRTERAVVQFQHLQSIPQTGTFDRMTAGRLFGAWQDTSGRASTALRPAPALADVRKGVAVLEKGQRGAGVKALQERLNAAGLKRRIPVDGRFDDRTARAVSWFQHEQGLSPDGVCDRRTLQRLEGQPDPVAAAAKRVRGYRGREGLSVVERTDLRERMRQSAGRKLDPVTRGRMEKELGTDLSNVLVHTGSDAERACEELSAEALTYVHNGVVHLLFAAGKYRPNTPAGDRLLLHELTHVLQIKRGQLKGGAKKGAGAVGAAGDALEAEADGKARSAGQAQDARSKEDAIRAERDKDVAVRAPGLHEVRTGKATLERGHEGPSVEAVQAFLNQAGAKPPVPVSGRFDAATERGVSSFQREQGFPRSGVVDRITLGRLEGQWEDTKGRGGEGGPAPSLHGIRSAQGALERGHEGSSVRAVQELLNQGGAKPPVPVTGRYDRATELAITGFQRQQGLAQDGKVGRVVLERLEGQSQDVFGRGGKTRQTPALSAVRKGDAELKLGDDGPQVRAIQDLLNLSGAKPPVQASGTFDEATQRAVQWFQREQGLRRSGTVDRATFARLEGQSQDPAVAAKRLPGYVGQEALGQSERRQAVDLVRGSRGFKLDPETRKEMEALLETDLSHVQVHTDLIADKACGALRSLAFTIELQGGVHIYFARGKYEPWTDKGRALLAHELTHARQIKRGSLEGRLAKRAIWGLPGGAGPHESAAGKMGKAAPKPRLVKPGQHGAPRPIGRPKPVVRPIPKPRPTQQVAPKPIGKPTAPKPAPRPKPMVRPIPKPRPMPHQVPKPPTKPGQIKPALVRPGQIKPALVRPGQVKPALVRPGQIKPALVRPGQVKPALVRPGQIKPALVRPGQIKPALVRPGQVKPALVRPGQVKPALVRPGQIKPAQVRPGQVRPGQVHGRPVRPGVGAAARAHADAERAGHDWAARHIDGHGRVRGGRRIVRRIARNVRRQHRLTHRQMRSRELVPFVRKGMDRARGEFVRAKLTPRLEKRAFHLGHKLAEASFTKDGKVDEAQLALRLRRRIERRHGGFRHLRQDGVRLRDAVAKAAKRGIAKAKKEFQQRERVRTDADKRRKRQRELKRIRHLRRVAEADLKASIEAAQDLVACAASLERIHADARAFAKRPVPERRFARRGSFRTAVFLEAALASRSISDASAVAAFLAKHRLPSREVGDILQKRIAPLRRQLLGARRITTNILRATYRTGTPAGVAPARPGSPLHGTDSLRKALQRLVRSLSKRPPAEAGESPNEKDSADDRGKGWRPSFQTAAGLTMQGVPERGLGNGMSALEQSKRIEARHKPAEPGAEKKQPGHGGKPRKPGGKAKAVRVGGKVSFTPRHKKPGSKQSADQAFASQVGDAWEERQSREVGRNIRRGGRGLDKAVIDQVDADVTQLGPLSAALQARVDSLARKAAARAERILSNLGHDRRPMYLAELAVDFVLNPKEGEHEAMMRLCAEIVRKVVGRWRHDEETFLNVD